jgi:DNA polymerase-1
MGDPRQLALGDVLPVLGPLLMDPSVRKLGHDLKRARVLARRAGLDLVGASFDPLLASYLLDPEAEHTLGAVVQRELGSILANDDTLVRRGRGRAMDFDEVPVAEAAVHLGARLGAVWRLRERMLPRLVDERLDGLLRDVELPLSAVLADLELRGVRVDTGRLGEIGRVLERELERLVGEAHRIGGRPFNVNAPRQLETLLFDEFGLKPLKRTKTARSTDAETLEALSAQHDLPRVILEIRQLQKLKGTYVDALPALVNPETGRIHTSWEQAVAATGRLSSTDPNLQNIPIRSELGRSIRAAFVAPPGHQLLSADYSQIELRVLAHLSQDPVLLEAFRTGEDIHTRTAMGVFELARAEVTAEHRRRAKAVNFGIIYGQGDSGLAKSLGISRAEASNFIAAYYRRYQGVKRYMEATLERARASESVRSLLGRRRMVPDIRSGNRAQRLAAERIAMNMPIQGTAADLLKLSMLALAEPVTPGARMILTVHDELVFEVPDAEVGAAMAKVKAAMQNVYPLSVPLEVDVGYGRSWSEAH